MFFSARAFLLASGLILLVGCAGESQPANEPIQPNLEGSATCLTDLGTRLNEYAEGRLTDMQVHEFWTCTERAIEDFQRLTSGDSVGGSYKPQAVRRFLQRYFIDIQVPDDLLSSLMEIKRVLLSGSSQRITRAELYRLRSFLNLARDVSVELNPHVRVILMRDASANDPAVVRASRALASATDRLGEWLSRNDQAYKFSDLDDLVDGLEGWLNQDPAQKKIFDDLRKGLRVLRPAKRLLLGGDQEQVEGASWHALSRIVGHGYGAMMALHYALESGMVPAASRQAVPNALLSLGQALEVGARARGDKLPLVDFDALFVKLRDEKILPESCTPEAMRNALIWFINRPLALGKLSQPPQGMGLADIRMLQRYAKDWSLLYDVVRSGILSTEPRVLEFATVLKASPAMHWNADERLYYAPDAADEWQIESKTRMIWPYMVIRWLADAYFGVGKAEATASEVEAAAAEILPVFHSFGLLLTTEPKIGLKLTRESDLFSASSNGDDIVQVHEATRYLAMVASAYQVANAWSKNSELACPAKDAECVRRFGADPANDVLESMPLMSSWLGGKSQAFFLKFMSDAEETVHGAKIEGEYPVSLLMQTLMMYHYIETFERRYDVDRNQLINLEESVVAYDLYGGILTTLLSNIGFPADDVFPFFTYMMANGDTYFTRFAGSVVFLHWKWHPNTWVYDSDRAKLLSILYQLAKLQTTE